MPRTTHCKNCNTPKEKTFIGKLCHPCYLIHQNSYYKQNKQTLIDKQREKRMIVAESKPPKKVLTVEEKLQKKAIQNEKTKLRNKFRFAFKQNVKKHRNPIKKNPDREIYCTNEVFGIDHSMFLNFDCLKDLPIEHLTIEHWINVEKEEEEYYKKVLNSHGGGGTGLRNDSYTKEDLEPEMETKNGKIRLHRYF